VPEIKKFLNPAIHTSQPLFLPVHFFRPILTLLFLAAIVFQTAAQDQAPTRRKGSRIIDDTTKQVYGPKTSRYYFEQEFFYNRTVVSTIDTAIQSVAATRGALGASINRLQSAVNVINNQTQNLTAAQSGIRDADISQEVANLTKFQILNQTGISALAQANQTQQSVLKLLQ